jgi:hypothetical protein
MRKRKRCRSVAGPQERDGKGESLDRVLLLPSKVEGRYTNGGAMALAPPISRTASPSHLSHLDRVVRRRKKSFARKEGDWGFRLVLGSCKLLALPCLLWYGVGGPGACAPAAAAPAGSAHQRPGAAEAFRPSRGSDGGRVRAGPWHGWARGKVGAFCSDMRGGE